ncbi:MAG: biopolymer transporter ExbD [Candidatus Omnitrophica bacterium]|nr:biopolymer transporter ExbD [Candidatus Omnitrophota bacterium]MBU4479589.1 biopolymer transporter ExbD [Candidatus Omnitrophota bacterium]MCG2703723.1 biopolymer transporter ExbD [Candidatus Omnitrophota bacterium]
MRFRKHLELERGQKEINITPLVDMVFLLLIFFMLTSSFIVLPGITINLPKAVTSEIIKEKNLILTINSDNVLYLNEKPITFSELTGFLDEMVKSKQEKPILIKADKDTQLGTVVKVWDICRKVGVSQINIATLQEMQ